MKRCVTGLSFVLVVIGALNWGLWGFFQFDFVAWLFKGNTTFLSRLIYGIIGLAGVWSLRLLCHCCHKCSCESANKDTSCCKK
jgi:uncharacterized membrane protein YuzA (DUF378 family)